MADRAEEGARGGAGAGGILAENSEAVAAGAEGEGLLEGMPKKSLRAFTVDDVCSWLQGEVVVTGGVGCALMQLCLMM